MSKQGETIHKQIEQKIAEEEAIKAAKEHAFNRYKRKTIKQKVQHIHNRIEQYLAHTDEAQNLNHVNFITEIKYLLEDITNRENNQ